MLRYTRSGGKEMSDIAESISTMHIMRHGGAPADGADAPWPDVVGVGEVIYRPGGIYGPRTQPNVQLVLLHSGEITVWVDDVPRHATAESVCLLLPGHREQFVFARNAPVPHSVRCCGGRSRVPPVRSGSSRPMRPSVAPGVSSLIRAAASSIARGNPSNRMQISATAAAFPEVTAKLGRTAAAHSTNSVTAGTAAREADGGNRARSGRARGRPGTRTPRRYVGARGSLPTASAARSDRADRRGRVPRPGGARSWSSTRSSRFPCKYARSRSSTD